jgi:hypothetical protein
MMKMDEMKGNRVVAVMLVVMAKQIIVIMGWREKDADMEKKRNSHFQVWPCVVVLLQRESENWASSPNTSPHSPSSSKMKSHSQWYKELSWELRNLHTQWCELQCNPDCQKKPHHWMQNHHSWNFLPDIWRLKKQMDFPIGWETFRPEDQHNA